MNLKNQLKHYLDLRDLSVTKLAKLSGVAQQTIHDWLTGNSKNPAVGQLYKVSKVLGCTVEDLCFNEGSTKEDQRKTEMDNFSEEWMSGVFEIKVRRIKEKK